MALNDSIPFVLNHERPEVYRVAVELHTICCALLPSRGSCATSSSGLRSVSC
jgi:hypothetical protein